MDYFDTILYNQLFKAEGMTDEEFDYALDIVLHTMEVTDSASLVREGASSASDVVTMYFHATENGSIHFNGAISSDDENKWLDGDINISDNNIGVITHVHRLHPDIPEEEKQIVVFDFFKILKTKIKRKTSYYTYDYKKIGEYNSDLKQFDKAELERFKARKVDLYKHSDDQARLKREIK